MTPKSLDNEPKSSAASSTRFGLFCKTFGPDIERFAILLESIERHARGDLPFVVSMPRSDAALFHDRFGTSRFVTLFDEDVAPHKHRRGWRMQQLVKLYAYRVDFADAWLWMDSDSYFVRPFGRDDFVKDGKIAAIASMRRHVLDDHEADIIAYLEDPSTMPEVSPEVIRANSRIIEPTPSWRLRGTRALDKLKAASANDALRRIPPFFGRKGPYMEYLPCSVWTQDSLRSLETHVQERCGWSFREMIDFAPWEAAWVGEWEWFRGAPGRFFIEPPMLHIREDHTIERARQLGLTEQSIGNRYQGLQLAARHQLQMRLSVVEH